MVCLELLLHTVTRHSVTHAYFTIVLKLNYHIFFIHQSFLLKNQFQYTGPKSSTILPSIYTNDSKRRACIFIILFIFSSAPQSETIQICSCLCSQCVPVLTDHLLCLRSMKKLWCGNISNYIWINFNFIIQKLCPQSTNLWNAFTLEQCRTAFQQRLLNSIWMSKNRNASWAVEKIFQQSICISGKLG